jgi:AcrR family transcriptional regulator
VTTTAIEFSKYDLIVSGARNEIEERGIVGLRVQEVARQANCSVSLIYRHFTNRDGLLAHVLTEDYARNIRRWAEFTDGIEAGTGPVDYNAIIDQLPMPQSAYMRKMRWSRVQTLAASVDNGPLRERLSELAREFQATSARLIRAIARRNGITIDFDISSFTQLTMSFAFMLIHNEMLAPDDQMDDARMRAFYRDLISRYLS